MGEREGQSERRERQEGQYTQGNKEQEKSIGEEGEREQMCMVTSKSQSKCEQKQERNCKYTNTKQNLNETSCRLQVS